MKDQSLMLPATFVLCCCFAFLSCHCAPGDRTIRVGQRIHHDDFEYSVTSYSISQTVGEGNALAAARGRFYIVAFQVENNAKRVNHKWVDSIAYIVDGTGVVYENLPWAQKLVDRKGPFTPVAVHVTPPGSSDSTVLVFDLPEDVKAPGLMVRGETLMGDFFDGGQFRKVKIALW